MTMKTISISQKEVLTSVIFNVFAIAFIFLIPSFSHLLGFALYNIDPMRFALFLAILITNRKNAYFVALLLPLVSFLISSHPYLYKVMLISGELLINTWLFYFLSDRFKNVFASAFVSILVSKSAYYLVKFMLISFALVETNLISTSLVVQLVVTILISGIVALSMRKWAR